MFLERGEGEFLELLTGMGEIRELVTGELFVTRVELSVEEAANERMDKAENG